MATRDYPLRTVYRIIFTQVQGATRQTCHGMSLQRINYRKRVMFRGGKFCVWRYHCKTFTPVTFQKVALYLSTLNVFIQHRETFPPVYGHARNFYTAEHFLFTVYTSIIYCGIVDISYSLRQRKDHVINNLYILHDPTVFSTQALNF